MSSHAKAGALTPPPPPEPAAKLAPGKAKKDGKVIFVGGNRLLASKVSNTPPKHPAASLLCSVCYSQQSIDCIPWPVHSIQF